MNARELPLPKWTGLAIVGLAIAAAFAITIRYGLGAALILLAGGALVLFIWLAFRAVQSVTEPDDSSILLEVAPTNSAARKTAAFRALKDLETERGLGNLSDDDFKELEARYRDDAKEAMREVDEERKNLRERAEAIAERAIAKALGEGEEPADEEPAKPAKKPAPAEPEEKAEDEPVVPAPAKVACTKCKTSNDPDAAFCKRCGESLA